jgi:hypothetical protein
MKFKDIDKIKVTISETLLFYLNSQRNTNFSGSFQPDQEKACNICPFQRFQYFPKQDGIDKPQKCRNVCYHPTHQQQSDF